MKSSVFVLVLRCMFRPPFTPTSKLFAHVFVYVSMVHIATLNFGGEGVCQQRTPPYMVSRLAKCCKHFSDVWNAAHTHFNFAFYVPLRVHVLVCTMHVIAARSNLFSTDIVRRLFLRLQTMVYKQMDATETRLIYNMHKAGVQWHKIKEITGRSIGTVSRVLCVLWCFSL